MTDKPVDGELLEPRGKRIEIEARAIDRADRHLRRLPLHGGGQQAVAVTEPFVERFLGAAGAAGNGGHGELVALLDHQRKRCVKHLPLARRQRLACNVGGLLVHAHSRTVRYGST